MTRRRQKNKSDKAGKPRRERELHAKEQLANLLDAETRTKLENLKTALEKEPR